MFDSRIFSKFPLEGIHHGPQWGDVVRRECISDEFEFSPAHVRRGEKNAIGWHRISVRILCLLAVKPLDFDGGYPENRRPGLDVA